jgi:hypothetical protein
MGQSNSVPIYTTGKEGVPSTQISCEPTFKIISSYTGEILNSLPNIGDPAYNKDGTPFIGKNGKPINYHGGILNEDGDVMVHRMTPNTYQPSNYNAFNNYVTYGGSDGYGGYRDSYANVGAYDGPGGMSNSSYGPGSYGGYGNQSMGDYSGPGGW